MSLPSYAVEVKRAHDLVAATYLRKLEREPGVSLLGDVWVPQMWTSRKWRGVRVPVTVPIFPGYIFVEAHLTDETWRAINTTRGVKHMVQMFNGRPQPLAPHVVANLRKRFRHGGPPINERDLKEAMNDLLPGDLVRVLFGPFEGFEGANQEAVNWTPGNRAKVLLALFGGTVADIDVEHLQKVEG
jgi:transcription antitermination factor NusG